MLTNVHELDPLGRFPVFSPDGKRILFDRDEELPDENGIRGIMPTVWVMNADGTAKTRLPPRNSGTALGSPATNTAGSPFELATAFGRGDSEKARNLVMNVLKAGNAVSFDVCHEHAISCDMGKLILTAKQVSLADSKGKTLFASAPADVKVSEVKKLKSL